MSRPLILLARWVFTGVLAGMGWVAVSQPAEYLATSLSTSLPTLKADDLFLIAQSNPLHRWPTAFAVQAQGVLIYLCLFLSLFRPTRFFMLPAWWAWACLVEFHGGLNDVSQGFLGWMALSMAWLHPQDPDLERKLGAYRPVAWLIFGLSYTASGWAKWTEGPSWRDGTALRWIAENDLMTRPWASRVAWLPSPAIQALTWGALLAEFSALGLCWIPGLRWFSWMALTALQIGLASMMNFGWLSFGMLSFHLWILAISIQPRVSKSSIS